MPVAPRSAPGGHGRFPQTVASFFVPTPPQRDLQSLSDSVTETVTSADTPSATVSIVATVSESSSILDTTNATTAFTSTVSETSTSTDTVDTTVYYVSSILESSSILDSTSGNVDYTDLVIEVITTVETLYVSLPVIYDVSIEEIIVTSDILDFDTLILGGKLVRQSRAISVNSSNLDQVSYDERDLRVKFKNGHVYQYEKVSPKVIKRLANARSPGGFLHSKIIPKHNAIRIK